MLTLTSLALALSLASSAPRDSQSEGPEEFEKALVEVTRLHKEERWSSARKAVLNAVETHERQPFVLAKAQELRAIVADCDFWLATKRPAAKDVVGGKLVSYKESKGTIKLVYEPAKGEKFVTKPADFESRDGVFIHPAKFLGRSRLEVKGSGMGQIVPDLRACIQDEGYFRATFDMGKQCLLTRVDGKKKYALASSSDFVNVNRSYSLQIKMDDKVVQGYLNRTRVLEGSREKEVQGQFGFANCSQLKSITLEGTVDPAWIQGLIQARVDELRKSFDASYDASESLPEWLLK